MSNSKAQEELIEGIRKFNELIEKMDNDHNDDENNGETDYTEKKNTLVDTFNKATNAIDSFSAKSTKTAENRLRNVSSENLRKIQNSANAKGSALIQNELKKRGK